MAYIGNSFLLGKDRVNKSYFDHNDIYINELNIILNDIEHPDERQDI